ncbi:MAG: phage holin family protein [Candidatus Paceibacterota bacterium]
MNSLIVKMIAGIAGIAVSVFFLNPGVFSDGPITIILSGLAIGLLFFFIKPLIDLITLPLRILTLNLFSFIIIMFLVWITEVLFSTHLEINGLQNLFWTSLIVLISNILFSKILKGDS